MKISIITANYNCAKYLKDCIISVAKQKYADCPDVSHEHIIVDDCSEDNSYAVMKKYKKKFKNIKIFSTGKRKWCGGAYSFAAKKASGDIVGVLDADDSLNGNAVRNIHMVYEQNPDIMWMWTQFWICNNVMKKIKKGISEHPGRDISLLSAGVNGRHCFSHWRTYRNSVNDGTIFKKGLKSAVDKYMGYRLEELGPGGFVDVPMYYYRKRRGGLSNTGRKNWRIMKEKFANKRKVDKISPYPIKYITHSGLLL